ncbi:hypothetical protein K0M31_018902, partial [Melipona bicolor]
KRKDLEFWRLRRTFDTNDTLSTERRECFGFSTFSKSVTMYAVSANINCFRGVGFATQFNREIKLSVL